MNKLLMALALTCFALPSFAGPIATAPAPKKSGAPNMQQPISAVITPSVIGGLSTSFSIAGAVSVVLLTAIQDGGLSNAEADAFLAEQQ